MSTSTGGMMFASAGRVRLRATAGAVEVYADRPVLVDRPSGLIGAVGAVHDATRAMIEVERYADLAALVTEAGLRSAGGIDPLPPIDPNAPQPANRTEALAIAWLAIRRARAAARVVTAEGDRAQVLAQLAAAVTGYAAAQPHPALEDRIAALESLVARVAAGESGAKIRADAVVLMATA